MKFNLTVTLTKVEREGWLIPDSPQPVFLNGFTNNRIGYCTAYQDERGHLLGRLELDEMPDGKLYFYYIEAKDDIDRIWFKGLNFMENVVPELPTPTLKEKIVP